MKWTTYVQHVNDLELIQQNGLSEIICSTRDFSRDTNTSKENFLTIIEKARELNLRIVFEWDVLDCENVFEKKCALFLQLPLDKIDVIRVQDIGALQFVLDKTTLPIQLIRENTDHNLLGLQTWRDLIGERLDRLVLSNELNQKKLAEYKSALACQIEILVYGKILLFYTPRALLSSEDLQDGETLRALGTSEESPHSGFPIHENKHGTFMYHIKDLYLLDKYEELQNLGLDFWRVDLRDKDLSLLKELIEINSNASGVAVKSKLPGKLTRGYFQTNKTDVLFKKLKNYRVQRRDESYVGEIIEIQNKQYMALMVRANKLHKEAKLKFISPDGKEYTTHLSSLRDAQMNDQESIPKGELAIIKYKGGVWPKSQVYLQ
ncbi:MAG: hypothetical protein CME62_04790 [Halobacteriovoraceae bacterium]|nr:hypothetical protein [Halobacteriovoraceae bacterium]|tara:strand:+ start:1219 stop:2349 length:1131 start_codon:yes stop_codon:yes gene_type:complete